MCYQPVRCVRITCIFVYWTSAWVETFHLSSRLNFWVCFYVVINNLLTVTSEFLQRNSFVVYLSDCCYIEVSNSTIWLARFKCVLIFDWVVAISVADEYCKIVSVIQKRTLYLCQPSYCSIHKLSSGVTMKSNFSNTDALLQLLIHVFAVLYAL